MDDTFVFSDSPSRDERLRLHALQLALGLHRENSRAEDVVHTAKRFETFLRGEL